MFKFKQALESVLRTHPDDELRTLLTPWGEDLDDDAILQEYPRPQLRRQSYVNLNGWWSYAIAETGMAYDEMPSQADGRIRVPFSPEAALSGVGRQLQPHETLWYRRDLELSTKEQMRYLLHFEAVDFECTCYVNGMLVGQHMGGYCPFAFDVTDALRANCGDGLSHEVVLAVQDPSETGGQPRGKQRMDRGSIWYTAQSGIWQTAWLEEVPATYIAKLDVIANPDDCLLEVNAFLEGDVPVEDVALEVELIDGERLVARATSPMQQGTLRRVGMHVEDPRLWSPDNPHLYDLRIVAGTDDVRSYCAFRTFTVEASGKAPGSMRAFCCNHEPLFLKGVLDQGYWSDGLLTAPNDDALIYDIKLAKRLGFNMIRKHAKVEQARWYYHCDKLGMVVWQDMVNGGADYPDFYTSKLPILFPRVAEKIDDTKGFERFGSQSPDARALWLDGAISTIEHLNHFACISTWTVFNEGWGQFCANEMTNRLSKVDSTRSFDQASGWFDQGGGDFFSEHNYFRTITLPKGRGRHDERGRVISEFGGVAYQVKEHSALERSYGYSSTEDENAFAEAILKTLRQADALEKEGLSGYVYTQLSDVEEETNGFVTYNRMHVKVDLDAWEQHGRA